MALLARSLRNSSCLNCQQWVLRSFVSSITGVTPIAPSRRHGFARFSSTERRSSGSVASARDSIIEDQRIESTQTDYLEESKVAEQDLDTASTIPSPSPAAPTSTSTSTDLPWYLRVDQVPYTPANHTEHTNPLLARQHIPDLPTHPPRLLQPLLEHISTDLGLDDLAILDLRAIDPPPALGANLLMIVATARSEKHLHVSADRLCRWLRTEHRLRPHADGLLGRNELKIQMRRRARRTRLLSSAVGAKETGAADVDDGLRTGWVCVNVGRVEGGDLPEHAERLQRAEGFVGFGARIEGYSSLVVQMLTEEKRVEVDLEKLWRGILQRAERDRDAADAGEVE